MTLPWARQGRCLLCSFRLCVDYTFRENSTRAYRTSSALLKNRLTLRREEIQARRTDTRKKPKSRSEPFASTSHRRLDLDTVNARRGKTISRSLRLEDDDDVIRERVRKRLRYITARLESLSNSGRDDITKTDFDPEWIKSWDADGTRWKSFEEDVDGSLEKALDTEQSKQEAESLMSRLAVACRQPQWQAEVDRQLRFAFYDYILASKEGNELKTANADLKYPTEWYPFARAIQRQIHLHVGPTNSGKTYNALKKLEGAETGFYAGPLRLLAHEVYSRLNNKNVRCELVTGDDVRLSEEVPAGLYAATVEMVDVNKRADVGVIDEIQMLADPERGWAWTRAFMGANATELHLCGEARVVPLIRELTASLGDTLHIHEYDRLSPLKAMSRSLHNNFKNLRKGDCIVCFSVVGIHALRKQIELDTGRRVAIVYGSLPPETRARQAALFNDPDNDYDYLVASDAIGMGLNLSIKRVVFETTSKWNGHALQRLTVPQIKQIAGRAGRYRTALQDKQGAKPGSAPQARNLGLVTCLEDIDLPIIQQALQTEPSPIRTAGLLPPGEIYEALASRLPLGTPFQYIMQLAEQSAILTNRFTLCNCKEAIVIAGVLDEISTLTVRERLTFCAAPAQWTGLKKDEFKNIMLALGRIVADNRSCTIADVDEVPLETLDKDMSSDREYLESLERLHKILILYMWLAYRFPRNFIDRDMATRAKELCEDKINTTLTTFSANPKLRKRLLDARRTSTILMEQARERSTAPTLQQSGENDTSERSATEVGQLGDQTALGIDWSKPTHEQNVQLEPLEQKAFEEVHERSVGSG